MKGNNKAFLKKLLFSILTITPLLFIHLYSISEIEKLNSIKNEKLSLLNDLNDRLEASRVEVQKLSSEEVIIPKAFKLGLIKINNLKKIHINKSKVNLIKSIVEKKYE